MALWIKQRPLSAANVTEIKFANLLNRLLPSDDYIIAWGFYYTDSSGIPREGDFALLCPFGGAVIFEVKGGDLRHFAPDGNFADNADHPIHQLQRQWQSLIKWFNRQAYTPASGETPTAGATQATQNSPDPQNPENPSARASARHYPRLEKSLYLTKALALPDLDLPPEVEFYASTSRDLLLTGNELASAELFGLALQRFFKPMGNQIPRVSDTNRELFLQYFGNGCMPEKVVEFIQETSATIDNQTRSRFILLDMLQDNRQIVCEGGTGSGKTWYAIEQARRYALNPDWKILFITYTRSLTQSIRKSIASLGLDARVDVLSHEELCCRILQISSAQIPASLPRDQAALFFDRDLPRQTLERLREIDQSPDPQLASKIGLNSYQAMVVDEAQDLDTALHPDIAPLFPEAPNGWWSIYFRFLKGFKHDAPVRNSVAMFFDRAQRPAFRTVRSFDITSLLPGLSQPARIRLSESFRYSAPLFQFLKNLYGSGVQPLVSGLGSPARLLPGPDIPNFTPLPPSWSEIATQIARIISNWQKKGLCKPADVLVLYHKKHSFRLDDAIPDQVGPYAWTPDLADKTRVKHSTIHKAKGIDSLAVILVGTGHPDDDNLSADARYALFMGASRAKILLAGLYDPKISPTAPSVTADACATAP